MIGICRSIVGSNLPTYVFFVASTLIALFATTYALAFRPHLDEARRERIRMPLHALVGVVPFIYFWIGLYCGGVFHHYTLFSVAEFGLAPPGGLYTLAFAVALLGLLFSDRFNRLQKFALLSYLPLLSMANLFYFAIGKG